MSADVPRLGDKVALRPAAEADIPALTSLLRRSWLVTWAPALPLSAVQHFAATDPAKDYGSTMWAHFRVADVEGRVLGMAHVDDDLLAAIHVDPDAKGRGVGTRLMDWAEDAIARDHAAARLEVRAFNVAAAAFYYRRGWVEARRYTASECGASVETLELVKPLERAGAGGYKP